MSLWTRYGLYYIEPALPTSVVVSWCFVVFEIIKCFKTQWRVLSQLSWHYNDVIMSLMTSQITGVSGVCSIVSSGADQRKRQSSASLAFVRGIHRSLWGIHRGPVNSPHKWPVTWKIFPFDDVIMNFLSNINRFYYLLLRKLANVNQFYSVWSKINKGWWLILHSHPQIGWLEPRWLTRNFKVSEWISNFSSHFIMTTITHPCWGMLGLKLIHDKRGTV